MDSFSESLLKSSIEIAYVWPEWKRGLWGNQLPTRKWNKKELPLVISHLEGTVNHYNSEIKRLNKIILELEEASTDE